MNNNVLHSKDGWTFQVKGYIHIDYGNWFTLRQTMDSAVKQFALEVGVHESTVDFELITQSRRYKRMVAVCTKTSNLAVQPEPKDIMNFNLMDWLTD